MQDAELCKELLQRILPDLEIDHIEYPELQKAIKPDAAAKSIRLDVYIRDDAVKRAKKNREWRHEYMTLLMRDQENIEKGIEKGTLQERRKIIIRMIGQGFNDVQIMSLCETNEEEISECRRSMHCQD